MAADTRWSGRLSAAAIAATCVCAAPFATQASHFPLHEGNRWEFTFSCCSGGWGISLCETGNVTWEITSIEQMESYPVQYRITIAQTRGLERKWRSGGIWGDEQIEGVEYDSTFNPPCTTSSSLVLRGVDGTAGLWFEGDSCWSFLLDYPADIPNNQCTALPVKAWYAGDSIAAVRVDARICRAGGDTSAQSWYPCMDPEFFTVADGIGPVAWQRTSSPCLMDAYWSERWTLNATTLNVGGFRPDREAGGRLPDAVASRVRRGAGWTLRFAPRVHGPVPVSVTCADGRTALTRTVAVSRGEALLFDAAELQGLPPGLYFVKAWADGRDRPPAMARSIVP